jgi:hypothetical protein
MEVCIINGAKLPEPALHRAQTEADLAFASAGVHIVWTCEQTLNDHSQNHFFVRLRGDKPPSMAGPYSLDAMGDAIVAKGGSGYLVDAYLQAVRALALRYEVDPESLLGIVIVHELGHLLLGPGHAPSGLMGPVWTTNDVNALEHRWLRFNGKQQKQILKNLGDRSGHPLSPSAVWNVGPQFVGAKPARAKWTWTQFDGVSEFHVFAVGRCSLRDIEGRREGPKT